LQLFKWPIEHIFYGVRPTVNISSANANQPRDWHRLTLLTDNYLDIGSSAYAIAPIAASTLATAPVSSSLIQGEKITYARETETIDTLSVIAHGISIYQEYKAAFYRDYIPYTYGCHTIRTPEDRGALMINFCLTPGEYQPSGHLNISRAREFFINFTSSYVTTSTTATALALGIAINFLLISDGSAVLRYST
jgi:hypothetical protein